MRHHAGWGSAAGATDSFVLSFHTDGGAYTFSLKNTLDPCHYAIFSDQEQRIYEGAPKTGPILVPATP